VGVLLDRFGARRLLVAGAVLMAGAQALLAEASSVPTAALARGLLGCGDALTFISVLRLVTAWFPPRRNPLIVQLTGQVGQLGALVSSYPLTAALHGPGWHATFLAAASASAVIAVLLALVVRDAPPGAAAQPPAAVDLHHVRAQLSAAWSEVGTRLGFWTHLATQFSGNVFTLLWGFPFLVVAEGRSPGQAAGLLSLMTVVAMVTGPFLGALIARHPFHRSSFVVGIVAMTAVPWAIVLAWPGHAPVLLLVLLAIVLGINGPGSMIGFDFARTANPLSRVGSATGMVNVGGFAASLVTVLLVGVLVTLLSPSGGYAPHALRIALLVQFPLWLLGAVQVVRLRERYRASLAAEEPHVYAELRRGVVVLPG